MTDDPVAMAAQHAAEIESQKRTLRGLGDCDACGWREELHAIREVQGRMQVEIEGSREDIREVRRLLLARNSVAALAPDQISDSTPPGKREELRVGPLRVRGRHAVAAVAIALALVVSTALATHAITAEHLSSLVTRSGK